MKKRAGETAAVNREQSADPIVRATGVSLDYAARQGPVAALENIDISVAAGELVSIVGPSGCGKSTLLNILAGLLIPARGEVRVGGHRVTGPVTEVGLVFQRDLLLPWRSSVGNVMLQAEIRGLPRGPSERRARSLLDSVGLSGFEEALPSQLSGGMRQRVAMVRAMLHDPPLLLMDEPFGALDALTRDQMNLDLLQMCGSGEKTVVFVTHSIDEAVFLSDRVIVMTNRPGRVAKEITVDVSKPRTLQGRDDAAFREHCKEVRETFTDLGIFRSSTPK